MMEQDNGKQRILVDSVAQHGGGIGTSLSWKAIRDLVKAQDNGQIQDDECVAWVEVDDHGVHFRVIKQSDATPR